MRNGPKWILRKLLKNHMPHSFAGRHKAGFGLPLVVWLHKKESYHLFNFIEKPGNALFDFVPAQEVKTIWQEHQSKKFDWSRILLSFLVLNSCLERNFG